MTWLDALGGVWFLVIIVTIGYDIYAALSGKAPTISSVIQAYGQRNRLGLLLAECVSLGVSVALAIHFLWP